MEGGIMVDEDQLKNIAVVAGSAMVGAASHAPNWLKPILVLMGTGAAATVLLEGDNRHKTENHKKASYIKTSMPVTTGFAIGLGLVSAVGEENQKWTFSRVITVAAGAIAT